MKQSKAITVRQYTRNERMLIFIGIITWMAGLLDFSFYFLQYEWLMTVRAMQYLRGDAGQWTAFHYALYYATLFVAGLRGNILFSKD
ncbi:MAG TPA: hypothetical protein VEA59_06820 [Patescibacteria group bacterium]|nr:hypothetical protein [Patescibacteria group bacterium]